jgi:type I restriction enzyme M protein
LLPAGAVAGWDLHPLESAAFARRTPNSDIAPLIRLPRAGKVTGDVLKMLLVGAAGVPFYNRSRFSFTELLKDPANIKDNFGAYLDGFSDNIKEILYNFSGGEEKGLAPIYETLARKKLLYLITKEFASETLDLHPDVVSNHDMGLIYEYLIRKFKEGAAAGEQYTPRDV